MLHLLKEYAEKHNLPTEPGFQSQNIHWAIEFDGKGKFLEVIPIGHDDNKIGRAFPKCPHIKMTADGTKKSQFLWDTVKVITFLDTDADDPKVCHKHDFFVDLLRKASIKMTQLSTIADQLEDPIQLRKICKQFKDNDNEAKAIDKVTFTLNAKFLIESEILINWWKDYQKNNISEKSLLTSEMRCFASGNIANPARIHPMIKGLKDVGGNLQVALASFNAPSFCSYGLEQSANAAVSEKEAYIYTAALNHLVKEHSTKMAGAKIIHWFKKDVSPEDDLISSIFSDDELNKLGAQQRAKELLESIKTGQRKDLHFNHYYAMIISGMESRLMVRDWMEGQFEELVKNINSWFEDLEILNFYGTQSVKSPGIERVVTCLLQPKKPSKKYKDWLKPVGSERITLWHSAIREDPIAYSVIPRLVHQNKNFWIKGELKEAFKNNRDKPKLLSLLYSRMSLIKVYHIRKGDQNMTKYLNKEHPNPAYHYGRLLSVLAYIQEKGSDGGVKAGVIERFYSSASTTPTLVLGRLISLSNHHLGKLKNDRKTLADWAKFEIADILSKMDPENLPKTFNQEEQSLFALGFYQQIASSGRKDDENDNQNNQKETN